MEPIPYFYDSINRNAVVITPRQPLLDWINNIYPDSPVEEITHGTVYLVREKDSDEAIERWLQKNFDRIFQNELNNWHTDEEDWEPKRTYKKFKDWFDIQIHSTILDIEDTEIMKD